MSGRRLSAIGLILLVYALGCSSSGGSKQNAAPVPQAWNLDISSGADAAPGALPEPLAVGNAPIITDVTYPRVLRQGGELGISVDFTDPAPSDVDTLFIQFVGADEHYTAAVTPGLDLLTGQWYVSADLVLSENFEPGSHGFILTLSDAEGNVAEYAGRAFIVKALDEITLVSVDPANGAAGVNINTIVKAKFNVPVYTGDADIVLSDGAANVPGVTRNTANGNYALFLPDVFLTPDTDYTVTITLYDRFTYVSTFRTQALSPVPDPASLVGKVFVVPLAGGDMVEPEEAQELFQSLGGTLTLLLMVTDVDTVNGTIRSIGGMASGNEVIGFSQNLAVPLYSSASASTFLNPYFDSGASDIILDLAVIGLSGGIGLYDTTITGSFAADGNSFSNGIYSGHMDSIEVNAIISDVLNIRFDVCDLSQVCDDDGNVPIRAEDITGNYDAAILHLYDLVISPNPASLPATGGVITVTGSVSRDGVAWNPGSTVTLATTDGTWDQPGGVYTPDANGQFTATLTIADADVNSGDSVKITASLNIGELGGSLMQRFVLVSIQ